MLLLYAINEHPNDQGSKRQTSSNPIENDRRKERKRNAIHDTAHTYLCLPSKVEIMQKTAI